MMSVNEFSATGTSCPIHLLPNELLARLFQAGTHDWAASSLAASTLPFPVLICGVCKHWREVAMTCPGLWSTIHVPICSSSTPPAWVQAWIDRSKSVPLTITLDIPLYSNGITQVALLSTMIKYPTRRVDIRSRNDDESEIHRLFMDVLQRSRQNKFEQISLCFTERRRGRVQFTKEENVIRGEWGCPPNCLRSFEVSKLRVIGLAVYPPQFPNLTSLTVWDMEATFLELRDLFAESPGLMNLVLCRLRVSPTSRPSEIGSSITLPSLQRLAVSFLRDSSNPSDIYPIRYLRLPNLSYLEINGDSNISLASAFKDSLSSADRLHTLKLSNLSHGIFYGAQDDMDDISFLRLLTSIRHLHLLQSTAALLTSSPGAAPRRLRRPSIGGVVQPQPPSRAGMLAELRQVRVQLQALDLDKSESTSKSSFIPFPNLQTITLATLAANDLLDICHYVKARKSKLDAVYLSTTAQRHLSHTLVRARGQDTYRVPLPFTRKRDIDVDQVKDADDWLRERVEVHKFDPVSESRNDLLEGPLLKEMI
jgi:hypothetical protein